MCGVVTKITFNYTLKVHLRYNFRKNMGKTTLQTQICMYNALKSILRN
nr:MAG TPA: hypothetical protein [Caudoviricetes sp.]